MEGSCLLVTENLAMGLSALENYDFIQIFISKSERDGIPLRLRTLVIDGLQTGTIVTYPLSNGGYGIGNCDAFQTGTFTECPAANGGHRIRNCDTC